MSEKIGLKVGSANGLLAGGAAAAGGVGLGGSTTPDPAGLFAWIGGAVSVTVLWVMVLSGPEYAEFLSPDSFGGLGNANDSEGEKGRTDMGVRISSESMKPLVVTVMYCVYESLFWLWTLRALCTENRLVSLMLLLVDGR
jgi:hypothetical protein